jgi:hypothetical protein
MTGDDDYAGQLLATRHGDDGTIIVIDQADPRIRITAEFMAVWGRGARCDRFRPGDVLRIHAANRTVIYQVDKIADNGDLLVSWPD